jgi:hypothetical protein
MIGVIMPRDVRWDAETAIVTSFTPLADSGSVLVGADELAQLVSHASHDAWSGHGRSQDLQDNQRNKLSLLTPYNDEATRPFPSAGGLAVGAGFYIACSQVLGIPYRPSVIRAQLLEALLAEELRSWRYEAGSIAIDMLEKSAETATQYLAELARLNLVEARMPLILSAILKQCRSLEEVIPYAMQLRDRSEAAAFRSWSAGFGDALVLGDVKQIAKRVKELNELAQDVNKRLGIADTPNTNSIGVGFGPVSVSKSFHMPAFGNVKVRLKSHAWLLQHLYSTVREIARFSDEVERLFYPKLPPWLMNKIRRRPIIWQDTRWR